MKKTDLTIDFEKLENVILSFDIMDLSTGMDKRDSHLHQKVFNVNAPKTGFIEYKLTKMTCPPDFKGEGECDCVGTLKIKDVSNEIKFKVKYNKDKKAINGNTLVSLNQFHLTSPSFMGISVEDNVEVSFNVSAN